MKRRISPERETAYYLGTAAQVIGALLFLSCFVTFVMRFGDFSDFQARSKSELIRAFLGIGMLIVGGIIRRVGARGLAGSGVVLDPEKAREDLEPYSRMAGGMVKDVLDEANLKLGAQKEKVVMVKCRACGKLNAEDAKYCQECGSQM